MEKPKKIFHLMNRNKRVSFAFGYTFWTDFEENRFYPIQKANLKED